MFLSRRTHSVPPPLRVQLQRNVRWTIQFCSVVPLGTHVHLTCTRGLREKKKETEEHFISLSKESIGTTSLRLSLLSFLVVPQLQLLQLQHRWPLMTLPPVPGNMHSTSYWPRPIPLLPLVHSNILATFTEDDAKDRSRACQQIPSRTRGN